MEWQCGGYITPQLSGLHFARDPRGIWRPERTIACSDMAVIGKALGTEGTDLAGLRRGSHREEGQLEPTVSARAFQSKHS